VKVWIFKGEIMEHDPMAQDKRMSESAEQGNRPARQPTPAPAPAE
jgi:small subunit ribosomal protein S3